MATTVVESPADQFADELVDRAKTEKTNIAQIAKETREDRETREADETYEAGVLNQLGRIEEIHRELSRDFDNYRQRIDQAITKLMGMVGPAADERVNRAAKAVADAFGLTITNKGLTQPKLAKGAKSPFEPDGD